MKAGVTILICTYNGAQRLPDTLRYLAAQQVPDSVAYEIIIVDNASTDHTIEIAAAAWQQYQTNIELRIITESNPGLTYARETGLAHAQYNYIIFCDDDNWLAPDYVHKAFTIMEQHPEIGMLGGYGRFVYQSPVPEWLQVYNLYAGGPQADQSGKVVNHIVYGAAAVLRKSAYEHIRRDGFTPALTDRQGHRLSSGGDYELCYVLALAGYSIWYEESLRFDHFITSNRLSLSYYLTYIKESSHCFSVLEPYKILLKTQPPSLINFRWELFKSFWYHLKKVAPLLLKILFVRSRSGRIPYTLQYTMLQQRLQSYRHFTFMKHNFFKAMALQKQLLQESDTGVTSKIQVQS